jgi:hypothetical protein
MAVVLGIWVAVAGLVGVLAGLTGSRRVRRLRRDGVRSMAVAVPERVSGGGNRGGGNGGGGNGGGVSGDSDGVGGYDSERRVSLQYALADGRVLEKLVPGPASALSPGRSVLVWYDPGDPADVLVHGREGRTVNRGFVAVGILFVAIGVALAVLG